MGDEDEKIRELLTKYCKVAVVGASRNIEKPSGFVPAFLLERGFEVFPVNPSAEKILDLHCSKSLSEVPGPVEIVDVFRPSDAVHAVMEAALKRRKERGDVRVIWLQEGIRNEEARERAASEGLIFVQDRCIRKELKRLFPEDAEA